MTLLIGNWLQAYVQHLSQSCNYWSYDNCADMVTSAEQVGCSVSASIILHYKQNNNDYWYEHSSKQYKQNFKKTNADSICTRLQSYAVWTLFMWRVAQRSVAYLFSWRNWVKSRAAQKQMCSSFWGVIKFMIGGENYFWSEADYKHIRRNRAALFKDTGKFGWSSTCLETLYWLLLFLTKGSWLQMV